MVPGGSRRIPHYRDLRAVDDHLAHAVNGQHGLRGRRVARLLDLGELSRSVLECQAAVSDELVPEFIDGFMSDDGCGHDGLVEKREYTV